MINSLAKMYLSADQDVKLFFLSVKVENRILEMLDTCKAENKIHLLKIMDLYAIHKDHIFSIKNVVALIFIALFSSLRNLIKSLYFKS